MRAPELVTPGPSFAELFAEGCFAARPLMDGGALSRAAYARGLSLPSQHRREILERLDREGALWPVGFLQINYTPEATWLHPRPELMRWREEGHPEPWQTHAWDVDGFEVSERYSPWQLLYLGDALAGAHVTIPAAELLRATGPSDLVVRAARYRLDEHRQLDEHWRPLVKLLVPASSVPSTTMTSAPWPDASTCWSSGSRERIRRARAAMRAPRALPFAKKTTDSVRWVGAVLVPLTLKPLRRRTRDLLAASPCTPAAFTTATATRAGLRRSRLPPLFSGRSAGHGGGGVEAVGTVASSEPVMTEPGAWRSETASATAAAKAAVLAIAATTKARFGPGFRADDWARDARRSALRLRKRAPARLVAHTRHSTMSGAATPAASGR